MFNQKAGESLRQAWDRFKDLLNMCPHHGFESWRLVSYFYDGLTGDERKSIQSMCNGQFLNKDPDEAIEYLNELAEMTDAWTEPNPTESTNRSRPVGVYQLKEEDNLKAQVENLTRQLEVPKSQNGRGIHSVAQAEVQNACFVCGGVDHQPKDCASYPD